MKSSLLLISGLLFSGVLQAKNLEDRFQGSLLGVYLGDALGKGCEVIYKDNPELAPEEYRNRNVIKFAAREDSPEKGYYEGQDKHQLPGTYTDDTEETIALTRSVIRSKGLDLEDSTREISRSYKPAHGYSSSTGSLFTLINQAPSGSSVLDLRNQFLIATAPARAYRDSNGCAMRIAPLALLYSKKSRKNLRQIIYQSCEATHPGLTSKEGATLVAHSIQWALKQKTFNQQDYLKHLITMVKEVREKILNKDLPELDPNLLSMISTKTGMLPDVFRAADNLELEKLLINVEMIPSLVSQNLDVATETAFLRTQFGVHYQTSGSVPVTLYLVAKYGADFKYAMNAAAHVSVAGDADTIPAMLGSILGALYGTKVLPAEWMGQLYRADQAWKDEVGYIEGHHEDLSNDKYISWLEVKKMASELSSISPER